jgi:hypothetical protein
MKDPKPIPNPLLAWREIEDSVVIISPEDSVVHELNDTASFIWKQFNGNHTLREIAARLVEEYEIDTATALADIERLATALGEKGLLQGYSQVVQGAAHDLNTADGLADRAHGCAAPAFQRAFRHYLPLQRAVRALLSGP